MAPYRTAALARTSKATQPQSGDNGDGGGGLRDRVWDGGFGVLVNGRDWSGARGFVGCIKQGIGGFGVPSGGRSTASSGTRGAVAVAPGVGGPGRDQIWPWDLWAHPELDHHHTSPTKWQTPQSHPIVHCLCLCWRYIAPMKYILYSRLSSQMVRSMNTYSWYKPHRLGFLHLMLVTALCCCYANFMEWAAS
jgi:hypothetical protein